MSRALGGGLWKVGDRGLIDGLIVNGSARTVGALSGVVKRIQTGFLYHYAFVMVVGLVLFVAWFVLRTFQGLAQEERATLRYFADTLFDEMESALEAMVVREEGRAVDEYNYTITIQGQTPGPSGKRTSPPMCRRPRWRSAIRRTRIVPWPSRKWHASHPRGADGQATRQRPACAAHRDRGTR